MTAPLLPLVSGGSSSGKTQDVRSPVQGFESHMLNFFHLLFLFYHYDTAKRRKLKVFKPLSTFSPH